MISFPNAKINLGLYITEKRKDGFHAIETCFYPIPLCDALEILPSKETLFTSSGINIPDSDKGNLCLQAYEILKKDFDLPPVHIHLHKNIPIGAGLGGGSSDAAYTIKTLNKLFKLNLKEERMAEYAGKLGSDCPFFIYNKPLIAKGKGDEFSSAAFQLSGKHMILIYPDIHISTAEAYAGVKPESPAESLEEILQSAEPWSRLKNDFEKSILPAQPKLEQLRNKLTKSGAFYTSMSGSGSAFFALYHETPDISMFSDYPSKWLLQLE